MIHYEIFVRRTKDSSWTLDRAGEDRAAMIQEAELILQERQAIAVRVTKETMDEDTGAFRSITILTRGDTSKAAPPEEAPERTPLCVSPSDLYNIHVRNRIGILLKDFLWRFRATPFELLHRADLIEKLEVANNELQQVVQKISIPEAQATGAKVHEVMRAFNQLFERAMERVIVDNRRGLFPDFASEPFADACRRLAGQVDAPYMLGGGVANFISQNARTWAEKTACILDLADAAPTEPALRAFAMEVLEQPLCEIINNAAGLNDLMGEEMDLGRSLAALTRLAGGDAVVALSRIDPLVARIMPTLQGPSQRLNIWLQSDAFPHLRQAIGLRILEELNGRRRLRPKDAVSEIEHLRALAMALTASSGVLLSHEDVQEAFSVRSKNLTSAEFIDSLLKQAASPYQEVDMLIGLAENVVGSASKRATARWVDSNVASMRFERAMRTGSPTERLTELAKLQARLKICGLRPEEMQEAFARLGDIGDLINADVKLVANLARSPAPMEQRLSVMLRIASGEIAPTGALTERATAEAAKMARTPEGRAALEASPSLAKQMQLLLRPVAQAAGVSAAANAPTTLSTSPTSMAG